VFQKQNAKIPQKEGSLKKNILKEVERRNNTFCQKALYEDIFIQRKPNTVLTGVVHVLDLLQLFVH